MINSGYFKYGEANHASMDNAKCLLAVLILKERTEWAYWYAEWAYW